MVEACLPVEEPERSTNNEIPIEKSKRTDTHQVEVASKSKTSAYWTDRTNARAFPEKNDETSRSTASSVHRE